jgi:DNA-binding FrmR family transcriptional regulator
MSHTVKEKGKLLLRVRRVRGQVDALERALEAEKGCVEVLHQIAAIRGAMNALMTEVIEEHVISHIASPAVTSQAERAKAADELIEVVRAYLK